MSETADEQWHYERDGRYVGPIDRAALIDLIQSGTISPDTLVCLGQGEWIPAKRSELSSFFGKPQRTPWSFPAASPFFVILLLNIVVFVVMVAAGVGLFEPKVSALLDWGANFGPKTTGGEWWRLLTCTFVHIGLLHIVFNMYVFLQIGSLMQRLMGRTAFTIAYLVSGLAGSLTSLAWNPYVVSAGASGAIFGLYGALLGFSLVQRGRVPSKVLSSLVGNAVVFIGFNVVYGLARPGTDMAAHVGGLIGGFVCSLGLCATMPTSSRTGRIVRNVGVSIASAIVIVLAAINLPHFIDLPAELKQFAELEHRVVVKFNSSLQNLQTGKLKAADFASVVQSDILPEWIAEHDAMSRWRGLPYKQGRIVTILIQYMELREKAWTEFAEGVRENRTDKLQDASKKQREAALVLQEVENVRKGQ